MRVDVRRHADEHPLPRPGQRRDPRDLAGRVDHDPTDPAGHRGLQVARRLRVAVQHDPVRGKAGRCRHGQLTLRADIQAEPLLIHPARHGPAQERLARVGDLRVRERLPVLAAALAHIVLVQDVSRRAVTRGDRGQRDTAHGYATVGHGARGERPDARGQIGVFWRWLWPGL